MKKFIISIFLLNNIACLAQQFTTSFEKTKGLQTTDYFGCIAHYNELSMQYNTINIKKFMNKIVNEN